MLIYKEHYGVSSECKGPNMMRIHELQSIFFEERRLYDTTERERERERDRETERDRERDREIERDRERTSCND